MIENEFISSGNISWIYKCIDKENINPINWNERADFSGANIRNRLMSGFNCKHQDPWLAANVAVASLKPEEKGALYITFLDSLTSSVGRQSIYTISNLLSDGLRLLQKEEQIPISEYASNEVLKYCINKITKFAEGDEGKSKFRLSEICNILLEFGFINPSFYSYLKNAGEKELSRYQKIDDIKAIELKILNEDALNVDPSRPEEIHKLDQSANFAWLANPFCDPDLVDKFFHVVTDEFQAGTGGNVWAASNYLIHNPNISKDKITDIISKNDFSMSTVKHMTWPMSQFQNLSENEVFDYVSMNRGVLSVKAVPPQKRAVALARLLQGSIDKADNEAAIRLINACSGTPILGMLNPSMRFQLLQLTYMAEANHIGILLGDLSMDALQVIDMAISGVPSASISKELNLSQGELSRLMSIIFTECTIRLSRDDAYLSKYGLTQFLESGIIRLSDQFSSADNDDKKTIADYLMNLKVNPELMENLISASLNMSTKNISPPIRSQKRNHSL